MLNYRHDYNQDFKERQQIDHDSIDSYLTIDVVAMCVLPDDRCILGSPFFIRDEKEQCAEQKNCIVPHIVLHNVLDNVPIM